MVTFLLYDRRSGDFEKYHLKNADTMPLCETSHLTVKDFITGSDTSLVWSDTDALKNINNFFSSNPDLCINLGFRRIWEGGDSPQSQHYCGIALDFGKELASKERGELRIKAIRSGNFTFIEPGIISDDHVHVDCRYGFPACYSGGYPELNPGDKGVYVLVLQDALSSIGFPVARLSGVFDKETLTSLNQFQNSRSVPQTSSADCRTWQILTRKACGIGRTNTIVTP